jgi:tRNA G18 (ribose-2'-O)-methylase SpoU
VVRSADAFGASAVVITGHAADPLDPKAGHRVLRVEA